VDPTPLDLGPSGGRPPSRGKSGFRFELWMIFLVIVFVGIVLVLVTPRRRLEAKPPLPYVLRWSYIYPNERRSQTYEVVFLDGLVEFYETDWTTDPKWAKFKSGRKSGKVIDVVADRRKSWPEGATPRMHAIHERLLEMFQPEALAALEKSDATRVVRHTYPQPYNSRAKESVKIYLDRDDVESLRALERTTDAPLK
jgi:hypothetical protein